MASTRSTFFFFITLVKSVVTAARMLNECATNSHDECWKCLSFNQHITLWIQKDEISRYTLGWSVDARQIITNILPWAVNTKNKGFCLAHHVDDVWLSDTTRE